MELCDERGEMTIRVRRDDLAYISEHNKGLFKVIPDDSLKEPGFIIETTFGDIDGRLSTQLEELKKELTAQRGD
jgi:flagellar biosynthesis/type III secretory pathway protein FliH